MTMEAYATKLMAMAEFTRTLKKLATEVNGPDPHWEADRQAEIDALEAGAIALRVVHSRQEDSALYEVAKQVCHEHGMPWTDPRTGIYHPPPTKP